MLALKHSARDTFFGGKVRYTKDNGIDLIAVRKVAPDLRFSMMVQCKRFSEKRKVGVELVREIWSVKWEHGFHQALLATTSTFTRGAKQKGELWNLDLRDQAAIADWCTTLAGGKVQQYT
ncbi:restriction endonuclease [Variovorax sp. CF079]|uniref:restriction endonuclease n=1 Tax=Variovorax sp. CF079 TaxID=1882774 RepID=UPI000B8A576A|nr:restriction endonuclease [Variovorax sp. CF079]